MSGSKTSRANGLPTSERPEPSAFSSAAAASYGALLPRVLVDRDGEGGRRVAEHRGDDYAMHSLTPELGSDRVADVM
jgi:hypothetical protein